MLDGILKALEEAWRAFATMPTLVFVWPLALITFVILFFIWYRRDVRLKPGSLEWIEWLHKPRLTMTSGYGRLEKRDALPLLALTAAYAAIAFLIVTPQNRAPQSFWQATSEEPSVTLDLGKTYELDTVFYYPGLWHGNWTLEFSTDGETWRTQPAMEQPHADLFKWRFATLEAAEEREPTRYVRMTAQKTPMELGELCFVGVEDGRRETLSAVGITSDTGAHKPLFDEQNLIPHRAMPDNGTIFDEIYHARTAYEHVRNVYPYEITHPPLGKIILSTGIRIFGMTPFGWRFMGILFGIFMIPVMYMLAKTLFKRTDIAFLGAALLAVESMHFTQTRLATIDTYVVFFIMLMYLFMFRYISSGYDTPLKKTLPSLILCITATGLAIACKWTAFYAAAGILILFAVYHVKRWKHNTAEHPKERLPFLLTTLGLCVVFLILIPGILYLLSYIPYVTAAGRPLTFGNLWDEMARNQTYMWNYHSGVTDEHVFMSRWYMWIFDIRPILYYGHHTGETSQMVAAFTNPLITLGGLFAFVATALRFLQRRGKIALFLIVGYLAQLVPWMFITRIQFAYHYFASTIFLILMLCYVFKIMQDREPRAKRRIYVFVGLSALLFILFMPVQAGLTVPNWYSDYVMKWLPTWPF